MRFLLFPAALAGVLVLGPAVRAQFYPRTYGPDPYAYRGQGLPGYGYGSYYGARVNEPPRELVGYWLNSYLRRPGDPAEVGYLARELRAGTPAIDVLSQLLASREYYDYAGGTRSGYVAQLVLDVGHHQPDGQEISRLLRSLGGVPRAQIARSFLEQYGNNWVPGLYGNQPIPGQ